MKKKILRIGIQILVFFVFLELGLMIFVYLDFIRIGKPSYNFKTVEHFWNDSDPAFGAWRKPYHEYLHISSCFNVNYKANSIGARDKERKLHSSQNRVIVIGDSYAEGWGVETNERFSEQLENMCQLEFINMGMSNFGPTQQYLLYKHKAKQYDHNSILWTLFPENDVIDDDLSYWTSIHTNQYRAFWEGEYPNYKLIYGPDTFKEGIQGPSKSFNGWKGLLKNFTYTYHLLKYLRLKYIQYTILPRESHLGHSGYFKIDTQQWNRMKHSIEKLLTESQGKKINIVTIPSKYDILKNREEKFAIPLRDSLEKLSKQLGFSYYDLLKEFDKDTSGIESKLYFDCDDHWNAIGHQWAAKKLDSVFSFNKNVKSNK